MADIVDPGASGGLQEEGQAKVEAPARRPGTWAPGVSGNPSGVARDPQLSVQAGRPTKPQILVDLEWAYRNVETTLKPKNAQQDLFRGDFIQDREKTLKLLVGLQKEYRDRVKVWQDKVGAVSSVVGTSSGQSSVGAVVGLGPDEGEERVRDMMKRLLEEAHVSVRVVPEGDGVQVEGVWPVQAEGAGGGSGRPKNAG